MDNSYFETVKEISERVLHSNKINNTKKYFKEHWIAIAALIISILSLAVSIIALNKMDNNAYYCYYQCDSREDNV